MIRITQEDLIRYIYKETSLQKTEKIKAALQSDWNLRETYEQLLKTQNNLDEINFSPRKQSIDKILEYASKRQVSVS